MDWANRKVLGWRLAITMDVDFCVAAMEDAIAHYGVPEIVNTDQGSSSRAASSRTCSRRTRSAKLPRDRADRRPLRRILSLVLEFNALPGGWVHPVLLDVH